MRFIAGLLVLSLGMPASAHDEDRLLNLGSDLLHWCRAESEALLVGAGHRPSNWTGRHADKGNTLTASGKWRVDGADVAVDCRVPRGARAEFALVKLQLPETSAR